MGSDFAQLGFDFIRHMECVDEGRDAFGGHGGVGVNVLFCDFEFSK